MAFETRLVTDVRQTNRAAKETGTAGAPVFDGTSAPLCEVGPLDHELAFGHYQPWVEAVIGNAIALGRGEGRLRVPINSQKSFRV
jgi:hypothetical protein